MTHIVRALVVWALLFAGCVAAFVALWLWSGTEAHWLAVEGPVFFGAVALWFGVQFGRAALKRLRERAAVGRADDGGRPGDGDFVVTRGTLQAMAPLTTPFTGQAASHGPGSSGMRRSTARCGATRRGRPIRRRCPS